METVPSAVHRAGEVPTCDVQNIREQPTAGSSSTVGRREAGRVCPAGAMEVGRAVDQPQRHAEARTQFRVRCDLGLKLDPGKLPPDVLLDPVVSQAELRLADFRVRRSASSAVPWRANWRRGPRPAGQGMAKQNQKLPSKINRQIDKNRDKLRLSVQDLLTSQWGGLAAKQLGLGDDQAAATGDPK